MLFWIALLLVNGVHALATTPTAIPTTTFTVPSSATPPTTAATADVPSSATPPTTAATADVPLVPADTAQEFMVNASAVLLTCVALAVTLYCARCAVQF